MADDASQENQHFEQVLNRLDALMKRGHASEEASSLMSGPPTFVILPPPDEAWADSAAEPLPDAAAEAADDDIPVLTDIYDGTLPAPRTAEDARADTANAIIEELLPLILATVNDAVQEEAERMRQELAARLEQEVAETIRQRLLRTDGKA